MNFSTHSLAAHPAGGSVQRIMAAALEAVEPGRAVRRSLRRAGDRLWVGECEYDLARYHRVFLVGAGKAAAPMAQTVAEVLGSDLRAGVILVKDGYAQDLSDFNINVLTAGHPMPDERGVAGAARLIHLLEETRPEDLVLALVSGGASAILVSPVPSVSLADLQTLTGLLLACGATVNEINTLRKHLEQLKGGGLARLAAPAALAALVLSDVVGDPLDVIGSGPTVADPSTYTEAWTILEKYNLLERTPAPILQTLERGRLGEIPETPKPGDPAFTHVQNLVIGGNIHAAEAALRQAQAEGFHTLLLTTFLQGEARQAGRLLAALARQIARDGRPLPRPACLVAGGETTVTLKGSGFGGRNQELALGAAFDLAGTQDIALVALATDGGDGIAPPGSQAAAGAVATGETLARAKALGLDPYDHLAHSDSYHFFDRLGDLLLTGPTRTNVNDLAFLFAF